MARVLLSGLSTDRVELNLAVALHEAGVSLRIIAQPESPAGSLCRDHGIPCVLHKFRHRFSRDTVALYRSLLREERVEIIHCLTNRALSTALLAARRMDCPPAIVAYRGTLGHLSRWDLASRLSYLNPRVDGIICVSDAVRRYLKGVGIPESKLHVIWKGHDPSWYAAVPRAILAGLGVPPDATVVCFLGNMRPVKGARYLLDAFDGIAVSERIHLLVIGEICDRRTVRRVGRQPHVHFLGFRPDADSLVGACDIAVMPSVAREGLPKAVLEAMAMGVPPVVTAVGGMPELVEDGRCGLVVPPRNPAALREAVRALAQDAGLRRRLGAAARARIEGPFHFSHTVEKTLALYEQLGRG